MKKIFPILIGLLIANTLLAQDVSDAQRLGKMGYMKYASRINCDSTSGSNLEHRVCLNAEFQSLDSIMNVRFYSFLEEIESDSMKNEIRTFQKSWVENRRTQSQLISEGLRGHMLGIYYLGSMVNTTRRRIEEIEYLIEMQ